MDCPKCGTYRWDTNQPCPNCNAPALTVDPMAEPELVSTAATDLTAQQAAEIGANPVRTAVAEPPPAPAFAPPAPWQPVKPYRPSGKMGDKCVPRLALMSLAAAVGVGLLYHYVSKIFNIFILMPIIAGLIVGAVVGGAVTKGQCRRPLLAALFGFLAGLIAYGSDYVLNSIEDRPAMVQALSDDLVQNEGASPAAAQQFVEKHLSPWAAFRMDFQAHAAAGVTISHYGVGGTPVTGWGYYAIVGLETLLFAGAAAGVPMGMAKKRYCETCNFWFKSNVAYTTSPGGASPVLSAVQAHNWEAAAAAEASNPVRTKANVSVSVERCPNCDDALISATSTDGKNVKKIFDYFLPVEDVQRLKAIGRVKSA